MSVTGAKWQSGGTQSSWHVDISRISISMRDTFFLMILSYWHLRRILGEKLKERDGRTPDVVSEYVRSVQACLRFGKWGLIQSWQRESGFLCLSKKNEIKHVCQSWTGRQTVPSMADAVAWRSHRKRWSLSDVMRKILEGKWWTELEQEKGHVLVNGVQVVTLRRPIKESRVFRAGTRSLTHLFGHVFLLQLNPPPDHSKLHSSLQAAAPVTFFCVWSHG